MKLILHTEFVFDSAHYLDDYEGKCKFCHGHTYFVDVWIRGDSSQLQKNGILFDFGNTKTIKEKLDHKLLNEEVIFNPTAENLCMFIYNYFKIVEKELQFKIRIYETKVGKETYCETGDF